MFVVLLWRVWKWILHYITGRCELHRICLTRKPVHEKAPEIVRSLEQSKLKVLRELVKRLGVDLNVDNAVEVIIREKAIKATPQHQFIEGLSPCLARVCGVNELWVAVEEMRATPYQQSNLNHEEALLQLWKNLMPKEELTDRISKQWQEIGFQGNNPATDFRGMGMLGLKCLLYFSTEYCDQARSVLLHSKHPKHWYPFAVVGIDLTGTLYELLKTGSLHTHLYATATQWPLPENTFMEMFCCIFCKFNSFWASEKPENVMAFPVVKAKFLVELRTEIDHQVPLHL